MDKAAKLKLKTFLEDHIPFDELKAAGFWPKGTRRDSYEKIAERITHFFGLKTIYDYKFVCRGKMCPGNCSFTSQYCKDFQPLMHQRKPVKVDYTDLISQDRYLN